MQGGQNVPYSGNPPGTIPSRANTGNNPSPSPNSNPNPTPNPTQGSSPYGPAHAHLALYGTSQASQSFYGTTQVDYLLLLVILILVGCSILTALTHPS